MVFPMRKRVKPAGVWPSNGATCPLRACSHIDSIAFSSSHSRRPLSESCRTSKLPNYHGGPNTMSSFRIRSLRIFGQPLKTGIEKRNFSVVNFRRSDGFDDFNEFEDSNFSISSMIRRRADPIKEAERIARLKQEEEEERARQARIRQEEIVQLERDVKRVILRLEKEFKPILEAKRRHEEEQRQAHEEWMEHYEELTTRASLFMEADSQFFQFFEEYFSLKYPEAATIDSYLDGIPVLADQYKTELSTLRQNFRRIELASRRIDLETQLTYVAVSLSSLAERLSSSVITPSASAKRNVEDIIKPMDKFTALYLNSQDLGTRVELGCVVIKESVREISKNKRLLELADILLSHQREITRTFHQYRVLIRLGRWIYPLGESEAFNVAINFHRRFVRRMVAPEMGLKLEDLWDERADYGAPRFLAHWYLSRWSEGAPRSPDLDIAWRHLDVLYPFDMLYTRSRKLILKVEELSTEILRNKTYSKAARASLKFWMRQAIIIHTNILKDLDFLRYLTWLRLQTESRVYSFGDVPDTISRGLFNSRLPLSSDLRRFFLYVNAIGDDLVECLSINKRIEELKSSFYAVAAKTTSPSTRSSATQKVTVSVQTKFQTKIERKSKGRISPSRKRLKKSESSAAAPSDTGLSSTESATTQKNNADTSVAPPRRRRIGVKKTPTTEKAAKPKGTKSTAPKTGPSVTGFAKQSRRSYSTDSKATVNVSEEQCGASQPDITLTKTTANLSQSVELETKNTTTGLVHDIQIPQVVPPHQSADGLDGPSNPNNNNDDSMPQFWSYNQHKGSDGGNIVVHYCRTLESTERVASIFSGSKVIGFDIEWKAQAPSTAGIKSNVSLLQIANEERIALFHLALFRGNEIHELVPPLLKQILESADIIKAGVSIRADSSRVRRHLGIDVRSQLELSHLYKLVKFVQTQPEMVDRRTVNLSQQVEELLGLPLRKDSDVRRSDWTRPLDYTQVQYAASDAYACVCLYHILEARRKALMPMPPLPAFAELNLPIRLIDEDANSSQPSSSPNQKKLKEVSPKGKGDEDINIIDDKSQN